MNPRREVVVTGLGVVSPIGMGVEEFWQSLLSGTSGVGVRSRFSEIDTPHRIAAAIPETFEAKKYVRPRKALKIMCGPIQFGCAAAAMAFADSGLDKDSLTPERVGTVFGTETFFADPAEVADVFRKCTVDKDYQHERWGEFAMREIQPLWMLKYLPNMAASHISIAMDARGPSNSICQGEASGMLALMEAADLIQRGVADVVVAGGTGSQMALTATLYRGTELLSKRCQEPESASRPFDRDRDGMVVGEGSGAIVLESAEHAAARNANTIASISGWSRGFVKAPPDEFSDELSYHLQKSIERAGLSPDEIDLVNANAMGGIESDAMEARAIQQIVDQCPVVAHKSNFGNLGPGTSMVELIGGLLSIKHNQIPPSINCDHVSDDCKINVITEHTDTTPNRPIKHVLKSSFSSTGQIAAVVVSK